MKLPASEIKRLLKSGDFMIRMSNDGVGYNGFKWAPIGEWTECPSWKKKSYTSPQCNNGGLFGQSPAAAGYCNKGTRIELCETEGKHVLVDYNKIKVQRARIIAVNGDIPVAFYKAIPNLALDLSGCDLKGITLPTTIGGSLYLSGCDLKGITLPTTIGGSLGLSGCDLKGITLPTKFKKKVIIRWR